MWLLHVPIACAVAASIEGDWIVLTAINAIPVAVAYSFFVDNYISGLTAGATKG